ncbi:unnamed protein product [Polarella glacialis]|uniref:Uncharacterized protein n=1 Tax=Polarella glacialis TaxID=89957 RepID=A0A813KHN6_POLGL|nr:unnamed protein product [Polarella glacialis]|mmetsp:Transcript_50556/g.82013  ORF Transcript_50556/g.82013 Transcript_50556/m.82013 type:complete len:520 (-) Transcript_50556:301-1860(-)
MAAAPSSMAPPDRLFAVMADGSNPLTWGEMAHKRNRIANSLERRLKGDMIAGAVYGKNSGEWGLCFQVCTALGLRFSPINWHLVADEIGFIVDDCDADVVFFDAEFAANVAAMKSKTPKVKMWVCMDGAPGGGAVALQDLVNEAPADAAPPVHSRRGGTVGYTGGTTGKPKGALRDGGKAPLSPEKIAYFLKVWGFQRMMPAPIQLVCAPLYHAVPSVWFTIGLSMGSTFVFMKKFDARQALAAIQRFRINGFYMPPILLKRMLLLPAQEKAAFDLSSVRTIMSGGAACPSSVKQGIVEMFGKVLFELYGASEIGAVAIMDPDHILEKPLSCGKPPAGISVILMDDAKQRITQPRVPGEIFAKGQNIDRYHKQEEKTKEAMSGDYFSVGDVGYFDEDGYLYISDRKIDMVVSGGVNIYPAQVEEVLHQHPDVEDVAVFGITDEEYGERVHAALKLAPGRQLTAKALLDWCSGKIGKFQLPRVTDITFHTEDFPRSDAGKLRKKVLKVQIEASQVPRSRL